MNQEITIIEQKLREAGYEPYVAVKHYEYQKDITCEKICCKIIESQFCIVILNDIWDSNLKGNKPNPNVYWEYGLMTALGKKIIPIVLTGNQLAFNIRVLDTIHYTMENLGNELEKAIQKTRILITSESKIEKEGIPSYVNNVLAKRLLMLGDPFGYARDIYYSLQNELRQLGFSFFSDPTNHTYVLVAFYSEETPEKDINFKVESLIGYLNAIMKLIPSQYSHLGNPKIIIFKNNFHQIEDLKEKIMKKISEYQLKMDFELINQSIAMQILESK